MSDPDQLLITCPSCGGRLRTAKASIGTQVGCPSCEAAILVRDPAAWSPAPMLVDSRRKLGLAPRGDDAPDKDAAFKTRLRRTTEAGLEVDPDNPVMKRRDHRKAKHGNNQPDWESQSRRSSSRLGMRPRQRRLLIRLSAFGLLLILSLSALLWQRSQRRHRQRAATAAANAAAAPAPAPKTLESQATSQFRSQVWETIQQFCAASSPEALLPLIRDPDRVGPALLRFYSPEKPWTPIRLGPPPDLSALEVHRNFVLLDLPLADFTSRPIALEKTPAGFRIDWESFTGYSELSWPELRRTRPRSPVVLRAVLRPTDYYNLDFPSQATHQSFKVSDLHSDHVLYGYAPLDSPVHLQLKKVLLNAPSVHAVLRVRYPQNSTNDRQLEITEVLEKGWIFRDDDLPEESPATAAPAAPADPASPALSPFPDSAAPAAPPPARLLPSLTSP